MGAKRGEREAGTLAGLEEHHLTAVIQESHRVGEVIRLRRRDFGACRHGDGRRLEHIRRRQRSASLSPDPRARGGAQYTLRGAREDEDEGEQVEYFADRVGEQEHGPVEVIGRIAQSASA